MRLLRTSFLTDLVSLWLPGLGFGRLTTPGREVKSSPITISCSMSACAAKWDGFADYFKTWNWEAGFRYSRNEGKNISIGEVSQPGLRQALLDTNPATAFDPFLNISCSQHQGG